jgi:hypothetical protein
MCDIIGTKYGNIPLCQIKYESCLHQYQGSSSEGADRNNQANLKVLPIPVCLGTCIDINHNGSEGASYRFSIPRQAGCDHIKDLIFLRQEFLHLKTG